MPLCSARRGSGQPPARSPPRRRGAAASAPSSPKAAMGTACRNAPVWLVTRGSVQPPPRPPPRRAAPDPSGVASGEARGGARRAKGNGATPARRSPAHGPCASTGDLRAPARQRERDTPHVAAARSVMDDPPSHPGTCTRKAPPRRGAATQGSGAWPPHPVSGAPVWSPGREPHADRGGALGDPTLRPLKRPLAAAGPSRRARTARADHSQAHKTALAREAPAARCKLRIERV